MDRKEILAKVAAGELTPEEADGLLKTLPESAGVLSCKVSPKGAVSVYGLQRMPVTLYADQWHRLLDFGPTIRDFIAQHRASLRWKETSAGPTEKAPGLIFEPEQVEPGTDSMG
ncbi:MAG: hypothetical protein ACUVTW_04250 [Thermogutta sp.]